MFLWQSCYGLSQFCDLRMQEGANFTKAESWLPVGEAQGGQKGGQKVVKKVVKLENILKE